MCIFVPPLDKLLEDPVRRDGSVMQYSNFHFEISSKQWKKYFALGVLKVIHKEENLELSIIIY